MATLVLDVYRDPWISYAYLPGYPQCPHCGSNAHVTRKGWYSPGPRQVMEIGKSYWVWGRCFLCRSCKVDESKKHHYFLSYNRVVLQMVSWLTRNYHVSVCCDIVINWKRWFEIEIYTFIVGFIWVHSILFSPKQIAVDSWFLRSRVSSMCGAPCSYHNDS